MPGHLQQSEAPRKKRKAHRAKRGGRHHNKKGKKPVPEPGSSSDEGPAAFRSLQNRLAASNVLPRETNGVQEPTASTSSEGRMRSVVVVADESDRDPPSGVCFQCHHRGHNFVACRNEKRWDFCHKCGRRGYTLLTCTRCGEAHRRQLDERFGDMRQRAQTARTNSRRREFEEKRDSRFDSLQPLTSRTDDTSR